MRVGIHIYRSKRFYRAAACLLLAVFIVSLSYFPHVVYGYTPVSGIVAGGPVEDGSPVKMRSAPVDGETIKALAPGTAITVLDEVGGSDGQVWYQIQVPAEPDLQTGYMRSDFVTIETENISNDKPSAEPPVISETPETTEQEVSAEAPTALAAVGGVSSGSGVVANTSLGVNVRSGAGTSFLVLVKVYKGQAVTILGQTQAGGLSWYNITLNAGGVSYTGWICADYVSVNGTTPDGGSSGTTPVDEAYIAQLKAAGFPDSYCNSLMALHQKYPSWQFVPVQTGLDWNTVIANESIAGKNLVQSAANDARKSTDGAAYSWETNTWYGFDGAGWVCASPEFIAYCMDPRNFLTEKEIFQFETLEFAAYQNAAGVNNILSNTFMAGNYTDTDGAVRSYADTFVQVGSSLAVSPYHLASRCKQEQGTKGTSPLISGTYQDFAGYYNYFNVGAYTTSGASATVNGLLTAKNRGWNSIYKSISGGAEVVANNYVKKGQNTIYFEKFNVVYANSLYAHQYMTNVMAAISEGSSMANAYTDKNQAFVFRIPVYNNMPQSAVSFADRGNPNNWLSNITVDGYSLTPGFSGANTSYSLVVPESTGSINIGATAVAGTSIVSGTGKYSLNYGNNTITVTCISQSGASRNYTINVAREQSIAAGTPIQVADGAAITSSYPIGIYLTGVNPGQTAGEIVAGIQTQNCEIKLLNRDGSENTGIAGTGNVLSVTVGGTEVKRYEVVVYGDINGDGKVSNVDSVLMQKQILGIEKQAGSSLEAANASRDGGVTNKDLVILQKHILNIAKISQ